MTKTDEIIKHALLLLDSTQNTGEVIDRLREMVDGLQQGEPIGWREELAAILADQKAGGPPVDRSWACQDCGNWTPIGHSEAHEHEDNCGAAQEWRERLNWPKRINALLTAPQPQQPLSDEQINAAAKIMAKCMDYPWGHMTEQGRDRMRGHAKMVIEAAHGIKAK